MAATSSSLNLNDLIMHVVLSPVKRHSGLSKAGTPYPWNHLKDTVLSPAAPCASGRAAGPWGQELLGYAPLAGAATGEETHLLRALRKTGNEVVQTALPPPSSACRAINVPLASVKGGVPWSPTGSRPPSSSRPTRAIPAICKQVISSSSLHDCLGRVLRIQATPLRGVRHPGWAGIRPREQCQEALDTNRPRQAVENPEYAAFARRILKAYARRVATGDIEALALMAELAATVDTSIRDAVTGLRDCGYSWTEIGSRLGVTRQAAQQRWGTRSYAAPRGQDHRARGVPDRTVMSGESRSLTGTPYPA
jgi:hypothetical protein